MLCWFLLYNNANQPWSIASLPCLPPHSPSQSSRSSWSTRLGSPGYSTTSHQPSILTLDGVYVFLLLSPLAPFFPSPTVSPGPFSTSASPFLPCKQVLQYHFSSFHLHMLMYSCLFFSSWLTSLCITSSRFLHLMVHVLTCHAVLPLLSQLLFPQSSSQALCHLAKTPFITLKPLIVMPVSLLNLELPEGGAAFSCYLFSLQQLVMDAS